MEISTLREDQRTLGLIIPDIERRLTQLSGARRIAFLEHALDLADFELDGQVHQKPYIVSSPEYDRLQARRVREDAGLSRKKLQLQTNIHEITLLRMENGDYRFNIKKAKHKAYLDWLVVHGYKIPVKS